VKAIVRDVDQQILTVTKVYYHPDVRADLAILETDFEAHPFGNGLGVKLIKSISIPLGSHVDDWISDQFILSKVLVMGYPAVPWRILRACDYRSRNQCVGSECFAFHIPITSFHQ